MDPKIVFLGTGGGSIVVGKQLRSSGGIVVLYDDYQFHIDPGPGALVRAQQYGVNVRNTTAVIVTHNHLNHCNDVNAVIDAMTYSGMDKKGVLVGNETLFNGAEGHAPYVTEYHKNLVEKNIILTPGKKLGIESTEIRALYAKHMDPNTIGLKFFTPRFTLVYSSDTAYDSRLKEEYKGADILILNTLNPKGSKQAGHLNTDDAEKLINAVQPKLTLINHFNIKMLKADPLMEARYLQKATGHQVIAATDGMVISPGSYDASLKQKTLNLYK